jgi:Bacterial CdiA-CT RNAse A domain
MTYDEYEMRVAYIDILQQYKQLLLNIELRNALKDLIYKEFNPDQPRDDWGRWTSGGDGVDKSDVSSEKKSLLNKTDFEMVDRLEKNVSKSLLYTYVMEKTSTFDSKENAENLISDTLNANQETVGKISRGELKEGFIVYRFGFITGREAYRIGSDSNSPIAFRATYMVGVSLAYDPTSESGYRIRSAYPRNYNPRTGF